jgi:hypothetical protein
VDLAARLGPGRYVIRELDDERVAWGYWHAYFRDKRVNGGVCDNYTDGVYRALHSIARAREQWLRDHCYWDHETCQWVLNGELPALS